jgi:AAA+ superfamily predicted ATPase
LISIEDDFLKNLDFDQIIGHFAAKKASRMIFKD